MVKQESLNSQMGKGHNLKFAKYGEVKELNTDLLFLRRIVTKDQGVSYEGR